MQDDEERTDRKSVDERREQVTGGTPDPLGTRGRCKVANVEGWEPFDRIERSEIDDH